MDGFSEMEICWGRVLRGSLPIAGLPFRSSRWWPTGTISTGPMIGHLAARELRARRRSAMLFFADINPAPITGH